MTEQSASPTAEEIAALPENEFLELTRDCDRINAEYAFKEAGTDALSALGNGALATVAAFSASPYAPIGAVLGAALAGVSVWKLYSHFLKKQTHREATNILRNEENGRDLSDVLQQLLEEWISQQKKP